MIEQTSEVLCFLSWASRRLDDGIKGIFNFFGSQKVENDFDEFRIVIEKEVTILVHCFFQGRFGYGGLAKEFAKGGVTRRKTEGASKDLKYFATSVDGDNIVVLVFVENQFGHGREFNMNQ